MPCLFLGFNKPNSQQLRAKLRDMHIEYFAENRDIILMSGALHHKQGEPPIGSLVVLDVPDIERAEAFLAEEPYAVGGLFAEQLVLHLGAGMSRFEDFEAPPSEKANTG